MAVRKRTASRRRVGAPLAADRLGQRPARSGRGPRRGLLRHGAARARRADRRRLGPHVLHRRRIGDVPIAAALSPLLSPLSPSPAVCLLPAGIEPGHDVALASRRFDLLVSEPAEFPLFVSSTRLTDKPGELVPIDREQMTPLPPMRTVLRTRKKKGTGPICRNDPGGVHKLDLSPFSPRRFPSPARPADRDRHARPVVQRDRRPAELAAPVRRSLGHANRHRRPPIAGRRRRSGRRGHLAANARR